MKLLQSLDLYKVVIIASLVLLLPVGWWIKTTNDAIALDTRAIIDATKPNGHLEEIGKLEKQLEIVEASRRDNIEGMLPELYFDGQIIRSVGAGQLDKNQYKISPAREEAVQTSKTQKAKDYIVKIDWLKRGGKDFPFARDFLFAVLFNCESGARGQAATQMPSIWRLYSLKITNATLAGDASLSQTPPPESQDEWIVSKMEFARREPAKQ